MTINTNIQNNNVMVKSIVPRAKEVNYGTEKKLSIRLARQWCRFPWACLVSPRASLPLPMRGLSPQLLSFASFKIFFFFDKRKEGMVRAYLSSITDSMGMLLASGFANLVASSNALSDICLPSYGEQYPWKSATIHQVSFYEISDSVYLWIHSFYELQCRQT